MGKKLASKVNTVEYFYYYIIGREGFVIEPAVERFHEVPCRRPHWIELEAFNKFPERKVSTIKFEVP